MAILVVEDESDLNEILRFILRRSGHNVISASDGHSALRLWREQTPELILIDVLLPDMSGLDVCKTIRETGDTPVVFLTGTHGDEHAIRALNVGADDYITKPFSPAMLQARIAAVLRRAGKTVRLQTSTSELTLEPDRQTVRLEGRRVQLTQIEFRTLQLLLTTPDVIVPHSDLTRIVWGYSDESGSKTLKGHIHNLRRKLAEILYQGTIDVVSGRGYVLRTQVPQFELAGREAKHGS